VQRPTVLTDWREGRSTDGAGRDLPDDLAWQPHLWRAVLARVDAPPPDVRHTETLRRIREGEPLSLPARLSMFGHTRLPVTELDLLAAVGEVREVHLWLPQVSPAAWAELAEVVAPGPVRRLEDTSARVVTHPLLASLGRDSRELQRSLGALGAFAEDTVDDGGQGADSLLSWLQDDLRSDRTGVGDRELDPADRSVQVHACHGATRQVEVLREVLVGLMEDDPTLEPRDILVMCPDVEAYAPLFSATFGLGEAAGPDAHPGHRLRVRLADRGLSSTNPLLAMASSLVAIAGGRGKASEVLDLVSSPPVRERFALTDDELATLTRWVEQSAIRWGLTGALRSDYKLEEFPQNTWQAGLDRVLVGVALAEDGGRHLGGTLPLDDVGSTSIDLAGRFAEIVDRLEATVDRIRSAEVLPEWLEALRDGVLSLGGVARDDAWQVPQLERELDRVADAGRGRDTELRLADVRSLLEATTRPRPTRANFRTGNVTVATLVPMRSVPHRVVCLVGLDDGVFPRSTITDGDDVLARGPMTGERDPRSEDRQLLLDAVLAAREKLVVTYTGANEHSGQVRPPAVPLGELLDAVERTVPHARDHVLVRHPLQPFDDQNFVAGALGSAASFSFDAAARAGAVAVTEERVPAPPLLAAPLPDRRDPDVALADLKALLVHPVRTFLRRRLDVGVPREYDEVDDALPVEIDALEAWQIGDRVLRDVIAGADPQGILLAEQLRGDLPPLRLGERQLRTITTRAGELFARTGELRAHEPRVVDVTVDLGDGRRLTGAVPDVRGDSILRVSYGSLSPRHRLEAWVDLLALSASDPDRSWTARSVGWYRRGPRMSLQGPVDDRASALLRSLVDVMDRGLREPLPVPLKTGFAWAEAVTSHSDPAWKARGAWESSGTSPVPGEQDDPPHVRVFGRRASLDVLTGPPADGERWNDQTTRLGQYSLRIWEPLLTGFERVVTA
jgi:exodeoxyribonuclease V gamma subunit